MDERLEKILIKKYPGIFVDYGGDPKKTCMAWGVDCGDGWFQLIDNLCYELMKISNKKGVKITALQVKEKFGSLRFYYHIEYQKHTILNKLSHQIYHNVTTKINWTQYYWKLIDFKNKFWPNTEMKISSLIEKAEYESDTICASCGKPGKHRGDGWIYTACDNCFEQFMKGKSPWRHPEDFPNVYEELFGKSE